LEQREKTIQDGDVVFRTSHLDVGRIERRERRAVDLAIYKMMAPYPSRQTPSISAHKSLPCGFLYLHATGCFCPCDDFLFHVLTLVMDTASCFFGDKRNPSDGFWAFWKLSRIIVVEKRGQK